MEYLPKTLLFDILKRIDRTADRNSLSLVCKRLYRVEGEQRDYLRIGSGLHPAIKVFNALCSRFRNLSKLEIVYSGWKPSLGEQLGDNALMVLSSNCPSLEELFLNYCACMSDAGIYHLSSCRKLTSLTINFALTISSTGILYAGLCCKNLSTLHLISCMRVSGNEWIAVLGELCNLRELSIRNCSGIKEDDIIKLGSGWKKLRKFDFETDAHYQYPKVHNRLWFSEWDEETVSCDELKELRLKKCIAVPGQGLSFLLRSCAALEKLMLDECIGVTHRDFVALSQKSSNLRALTVRLPLQFPGFTSDNNHLVLKDDSLRALAAGCPMLSTLELSFPDRVFPSASYFTQDSLIALIQSCPISALKLHCAGFFNDMCMQALVAAQCLQVLELSNCQNVTNKGFEHIIKLPSLKSIKLFRCSGVTSFGLIPLVKSHKLDLLTVEDCPFVSKKGIKEEASFYEQILAWL